MDKLAKAVRVVTVPPLLVGALLLILYFGRDDVFSGVGQLLLAALFLLVMPVLAYPLSLIPAIKATGREGQRKLAFALSFAGYAGGTLYGFLAGVSRGLKLVFLSYFTAVALLSLINLFGLRASGHACSITGPLIHTVYFIGWRCLLPCAVIFAAIIWASLRLKRHTPRDLALGSLCAAAGFAIGLAVL